MNDDTPTQAMADHGEPRQDMPVDESKYAFSIDDAIARYKAAGIPRIRRTVQRYCSNGTLDAHRVAVPYGEKYLITPESLERHINYVLEARSATADHGQPRQDMVVPGQENSNDDVTRVDDDSRNATVADHGEPRSATGMTEPVSNAAPQIEIVEMLRAENKFLKEQIAVKDSQLAVKDRQIADQSERTRETNLLVASLHKLITPLLGGWENSHQNDARDNVVGDIHQEEGLKL